MISKRGSQVVIPPHTVEVKIWKYPLDIIPNQILTVPGRAQFVSLQVQDDTPCLWALVEPTDMNDSRYIEMYYTDTVINRPRDKYHRLYLGTFQLNNLVYHCFERTNGVDLSEITKF